MLLMQMHVVTMEHICIRNCSRRHVLLPESITSLLIDACESTAIMVMTSGAILSYLQEGQRNQK